MCRSPSSAPALQPKACVDVMDADVGSDLSSHFKDVSKAPKFERFAVPPRDIRRAVQDMRAKLRARPRKPRTLESVSHQGKLVSLCVPPCRALTVGASRRVITPQISMRVLTTQMVLTFEEVLEDKTSIAFFVSEGLVKPALESALTAAGQGVDRAPWVSEFAFTEQSSKRPQFDRFATPPSDLVAAVLEMRAAALAKREAKEAGRRATIEANKCSSEVDSFLRQEESETKRKTVELERLIGEELNVAKSSEPSSTSLGNTTEQKGMSTWLAGSPAAALRRSKSRSTVIFCVDDEKASKDACASSLAKRMSRSHDALSEMHSLERQPTRALSPPGGRTSAMELDLAGDLAPRRPAMPLMARSSSVGAVNISKSKRSSNIAQLSATPFTLSSKRPSAKSGGHTNAWSLGTSSLTSPRCQDTSSLVPVWDLEPAWAMNIEL